MVRFLVAALLLARVAHAGPELALREFASAQIKKGVRVLGMGGDGATWGNYSLVYKDAGGALFDYGYTHFTDTGNDIHFVAGGFTTPSFWRGGAFYVVVVDEWAQGLHLNPTSPAYPHGAPLIGDGSDQAVFAKLAWPLPHGFSAGVLLGWERSAMTARDPAGGAGISWSTTYLPSAGGGVAWEGKKMLAGVRFLSNNDMETRRDATGSVTGYYGSFEIRAGVSVKVWRGGLFDAGYVGLWRRNDIDKTNRFEHALVAGYEQEVWPRHLTVRVGWNETSPTAGLTARIWRFKLDVAYVHNLGVTRTHDVFGSENHGVIFALNYDYHAKHVAP